MLSVDKINNLVKENEELQIRVNFLELENKVLKADYEESEKELSELKASMKGICSGDLESLGCHGCSDW